MPLSLLLLLAACAGTSDKPDDTAQDADTDTDTDTGETADPGAPSGPEIVISPASPPAGVGFSVVIVTPSIDPDGDVVAYRYAWTENGALRSDLPGEAIAGSETADGEVWAVTVTPTDGVLDGPSASATVTVENTAPSAFGITFTPALPLDGEAVDADDLVVTATASDPDGTDVTLTYAWYRNGVEATDGGNVDTVPADTTQIADVWYVVVTAWDGLDSVGETSDSLTVIPWEGSAYAYSFTARIAPGGATATGTWAYELLSHGGREGENECSPVWDIDLTEDARACPRCDYSFDAVYTYDTTSSTVTTGTGCTDIAADGDGTVTYTADRETFALTFYGSSYYYREYMNVRGTDTTTYSSPYAYSYSSYGVTEETDTAGYTTLTAFQISRRYYY